MRFPRQEYWSGYPFSSPGDLPDSGTKPRSPTLHAYFLLSEPDMQNHQVTSIKTCFKEIVSIKGKAIVYIRVFLYHFLNSKVWRTLTQTWIASSKWIKECTSVPGTANCIVPSPWNRHKCIFFISLSFGFHCWNDNSCSKIHFVTFFFLSSVSGVFSSFGRGPHMGRSTPSMYPVVHQ